MLVVHCHSSGILSRDLTELLFTSPPYIVASNALFKVGFVVLFFLTLVLGVWDCVSILLTIFSVFLIIMGSRTGQDPPVKEKWPCFPPHHKQGCHCKYRARFYCPALSHFLLVISPMFVWHSWFLRTWVRDFSSLFFFYLMFSYLFLLFHSC